MDPPDRSAQHVLHRTAPSVLTETFHKSSGHDTPGTYGVARHETTPRPFSVWDTGRSWWLLDRAEAAAGPQWAVRPMTQVYVSRTPRTSGMTAMRESHSSTSPRRPQMGARIWLYMLAV